MSRISSALCAQVYSMSWDHPFPSLTVHSPTSYVGCLVNPWMSIILPCYCLMGMYMENRLAILVVLATTVYLLFDVGTDYLYWTLFFNCCCFFSFFRLLWKWLRKMTELLIVYVLMIRLTLVMLRKFLWCEFLFWIHSSSHAP